MLVGVPFGPINPRRKRNRLLSRINFDEASRILEVFISREMGGQQNF